MSTSSAFSNQPSLDSLAREEKPTPAPPIQQQPPTHAPACSHNLEELTHSTGCYRSDPSARSPVRRRLAEWNLLPTKIFPSPAYSSIGSHSAGLLADSFPPVMQAGKKLGEFPASSCTVNAMARHVDMSRPAGVPGSAFSSNGKKRGRPICQRCPRPREARGGGDGTPAHFQPKCHRNALP